MFHTLRKLVFLLFFGMLACVGAFLYQKRAIFNPLVDLVEVLRIHNETPTRVVGQATGTVFRVGKEYSFGVKSDQGLIYNLRLSGLEVAGVQDGGGKPASDPITEEARMLLSRLILSNHVRLDLTYLNEQRNGLAIVHLGETNINAAIAGAGLAKVNREYLKGLPWKEQYKLVRAERKAQEKELGLWSSKLTADASSPLSPK